MNQYKKRIESEQRNNQPENENDIYVIGLSDGTVKTGEPYEIYCRHRKNGAIVKAINQKCPSEPGRQVFLDFIDGRYHVRKTRQVYPSYLSEMPEHAESHKRFGSDPDFVEGDRLLNDLLIPIPGSLSLRYYGGAFDDGTAVADIPAQDLDLTASIPATAGYARWVRVEKVDDGTLNIVDGTPAESDLLTYDDIPAQTTGNQSIFAVRCINGMTEFLYAPLAKDVYDLRFSGGGGGGYTPPATTALNDFQVGDGSGNWIKKTLAQIKTILGLGGAAYLNVGTTTGTVAAGDDSRFTDSRTPTGSAGGELGGTYPNPTLSNAAVIGKLITGFVSGAGVVAATDSLLQAIQKIVGNIAAHTHIGGAGALIAEAALSLSDVTTANATTSAHGYEIKLSGVATQYKGGDGAWHDIPTVLSLFGDDTDNAISGYKNLNSSRPTGTVANVAVSIAAADTLIKAFAAPAGLFDFISGQTMHIHWHMAKTAGVKDATAYIKLFHRTSGGTETLLGTSAASGILAGTSTPYDFDVTIADTAFAVTDIFVTKIYASPSGAGTTPTATIYYQGTTDSRVEVGAAISLAGYQPLDSDLTAIAGLTPSNDDIIQRKSGAWTNRTLAQLITDLTTGLTAIFVPKTTLSGRMFIPFGVYASINPMTANAVPYAATIDRTMTLKSLAITVYVDGTNNASNYWTISLIDATSIASVDTSADGTFSTFALKTTTTFSPTSVGATTKIVRIFCTKTGSPGSLYCAGPLMEVEI